MTGGRRQVLPPGEVRVWIVVAQTTLLVSTLPLDGVGASMNMKDPFITEPGYHECMPIWTLTLLPHIMVLLGFSHYSVDVTLSCIFVNLELYIICCVFLDFLLLLRT